MRNPKNRSDLKFEPLHTPEALDLDYSSDIRDSDIEEMNARMPKEAFDDEGILISGEKW